MQILSQFLGGRELEEEFDAQDAAAEKARMRKLFANGPRSLKFPTNGQLRRAEVRSVKAQGRKANRRYRRDWMTKQQHVANLRGQIMTATSETAPIDLRLNAQRGILNGFGERDERGKVIRSQEAYDAALDAAVGTYQAVLRARKAAA